MKTPLVSLIGSRGDATNGPARWSRTFLLVVEVSLAVVLLVGAGLLLRSMSQLQRIQPGWTSEGITIFNLTLPTARYQTTADVVRGYNEIDERLQAIPGVTRVARISGLPLGPSENVQTFTRTDTPAPPPGQLPSALFRVVDPDYFATVQIPVTAGRTFDDRDREGAQRVVVISREMADEFWRGEDPIGKTFDLDNVVLTIVGVVAGVRSSNFLAQPQPEMYVPHAQVATRSLTILLASTQPSAHVLNAARQAIRGIDDRLPLIRPGTFAALESRAVARPRFYLLLLGLFALLALALAAVGVYGVVAYLVSQRTREIGIRVALGARTAEVLRLVIWQGLRPAIAGIALGLFGAVVAGRALSTLLYQVTPTDPLTLMAVISFLLIVVLLACVIPALRASRIPAAIALRSE
jgi:putative ABC transport system permease protein